MIPVYKNSDDLLTDASKENYYFMLIAQLNKDFDLANFDFKLSKSSPPMVLKEELKKGIAHLILNDTSTYNNLLYVVDVSEEGLKNITSDTFDAYIENIAFLILKRVWKKVWFRNKYSTKHF